MNPYQKYQQQVVTTMTPGDMLLKLYDEAIKQIQIARIAIEQKNIPQMAAALDKSQRIIHYLKSTLDMRYDVSSNLGKLYDFFSSQIVDANVKKTVKPLDDIEPLVQELRDTFDQCDKMNRAGRSGLATENVI